METAVIKRIRFNTVISIIFAITSLFYVVVSTVYFVSMIYTLEFGNEYEKLGFVFGLIGLPIALAAMAIPVFRIVILVLSIILNKKIKNGVKVPALNVIIGIMHILDAVGSPIIYIFIANILYLFSQDAIQSILGDGRIYGLVYGLLGLLLGIPVLAKGVMQIVSSVLLFKSIKK